jgi:hypothetical protein
MVASCFDLAFTTGFSGGSGCRRETAVVFEVMISK